MYYGGLGLKDSRTYRKHYSADGTMGIKENRANGVVEFVTYLGGDGYTAPIVYKKTYPTTGIAQEQMLYLHRDYQGSILAITNNVGVVLEKRLFDAWGNIAKVQDGNGNTLNGLTILDRGYTGHEHLQSVGLIHMNGRLYDPKLHRFLQPDNYVQDSSNTQNYNRYGYVLNNPLRYSDPTGEFTWSDLIAAVSIVVGSALVVFSNGAASAIGWKFIGAGIAHFGATAAIFMNNGGAWDAASNYVGFSSPTININTGWGDSKSDKNGITQNEPVVKPETIAKDDVRNMSSGGGYEGLSDGINTLWDSDFRRNLTGDKIGFSVGWDASLIFGGGSGIELSWILTGKDKSFFPYIGDIEHITVSDGFNLGFDYTVNFARNSGPASYVSASSLPGWSHAIEIGGKYVVGGGIGYEYSKDGKYGWHQLNLSVGPGIEFSPFTGANVKYEAEYNGLLYHTVKGGWYKNK